MQWTFTLDELEQVAHAVASILQRQAARVVAIHGPMGAGKTTFTLALARQLGSMDAGSSPTFALANAYALATGGTLYHMDWYRLADAQEAIDAGLEDLLYSGAWCVVEWTERAPELLPPDAWHLHLTVLDGHTRTLHMHAAS